MTMYIGLPPSCCHVIFQLLVFVSISYSRSGGFPTCTKLDSNNLTVTEQKAYTGSYHNMQCCKTGREIVWMKNGLPLHEVELLTDRTTMEEENRTLIIFSLTEDDSGNYTCVVRRSDGTSTNKTIIFEVRAKPEVERPVLSVRMLKQLVVSEGENVTLKCFITSNNNPWVWWNKVNTTARNSDGNYPKDLVWKERLGKHSSPKYVSHYRLNDVSTGNEGVYECWARIYGALAHDNTTLLVRVKPPNLVPSTKGEPDAKNVAFIALSLAVPVAVVLLLGLMLLVVKKKKGAIDVKKPLIPRPCTASKHNTSVIDNKGDANCICYDIYDVFISYNSKDRDWVNEELLSRLAKRYKVCMDVQDFEIGEFITVNIINCIWRSRKTILVLTNNFLNSDWTNFEVAVAEGRQSNCKNVLIIIALETIDQMELPPNLKHYYKSRTYLEWNNEDVRPHFWDRLNATIGPSLTETDLANGKDGENAIVDTISDAVNVPIIKGNLNNCDNADNEDKDDDDDDEDVNDDDNENDGGCLDGHEMTVMLPISIPKRLTLR